MLNNYSAAFWPVVLFALLAVGAQQYEGAAGFALFWIFAGAGAASLVNWIIARYVIFTIHLRAAKAQTWEAQLASTLATLDHEQLDLYREILMRHPGALPDPDDASYILIDGQPVESDFIRDLIASSRGNDLPAKRNYSEGSRDRYQYQVILDALESRDLVKPAAGPLPPRVKDWRAVQRVLAGE